MKTSGKIFISLLLISCITISCRSKTSAQEEKAGPELTLSPSDKLLQQYSEAEERYNSKPKNAENIIWYGRRAAYLGNYEQAIAIFTEGIEIFPADARFYRHRGHRFISLRKFDEAINDLEKAAKLIKDTENEIEADGMPNALNIPVSTLHGNIWYHLGLAYYLIHDYEKANWAYLNCRASATNPDNIVSSTHWLYMIQRRLGNRNIADSLLLQIDEQTSVIENHNYLELCIFYKGKIPIDSLMHTSSDNAASYATKYGLANWFFYNNDKDKSRRLMEDIVKGESRSSFGYIAAESDLAHYK